MSKYHKNRIPTLLGIFILTFGIVSGVVLLNAKQIFKLGAQEDTIPKNILFSNIGSDQFTVSFITSSESRSFIKISDDKYFLGQTEVKRQNTKSYNHYYTIENLSPEKEYYMTINTNGTDYFGDNPKQIKTGKKLTFSDEGKVIYGKVYSRSGEELEGAIVFAQCGSGSPISTKTSDDGGFMLIISNTRTADLSSYEPIDGNQTVIQILVQYGQLATSVTTYMKNSRPLPPIILGNNIDLRSLSTPSSEIEIPTPGVFGVSTDFRDYPLLIKDIYERR